IRNALASLQAAIEPPTFAPATPTKRFTIAANDFTTMAVAPRLLQIMKAESPSADIAVRPVRRVDLAEQIDLGRIDAAVGTFSAVPQRFNSDLLFSYDDVLMTSQSYGAITTDVLATRPLVVVSFGGEQDGAVDGFISERGLA
ncbi:LysR substrate-binding domain-containing protein, partial [Lactobacillus crispatus]|uniref:LysR substrate-binding domain-containing protein n=1 Tax=Lactobacillus crispatus TaxID=47770 RepID=UPI0010E27964